MIADDASVVAAKAIIDAETALVLTTGKDTIVGTDATYTAGDSIDGGAGEDTFALTMGAVFGTDPKAVLNNVETVSIKDTLGSDLDAANFSGVANYTFTGDWETTIENISEEFSTVTLSRDADAIFEFSDALFTGTDDSMRVTVSNNTGSTSEIEINNSSTDVIEIFNIVSTDNAAGTVLDIDNDDDVMTTANISGNSSIELRFDDEALLTTVDASALAGGITYVLGTSNDNDASITVYGGSGNDDIDLWNGDDGSTIMTGAGNDMITGTSGSDTITAGAGADQILWL